MKNDFKVRYTENGDIELYKVIPKEKHEDIKSLCNSAYEKIKGKKISIEKLKENGDIITFLRLYKLLNGGNK